MVIKEQDDERENCFTFQLALGGIPYLVDHLREKKEALLINKKATKSIKTLFLSLLLLLLFY